MIELCLLNPRIGIQHLKLVHENIFGHIFRRSYSDKETIAFDRPDRGFGYRRAM
jgi:hypothetical protein